MNYRLSNRTRALIVLTVLVLGWGIWLFLDYVPFYLPSYCIWGGIFISILGCVGVVVPMNRIGLTRKHCAAVLFFGLLLVVTAFLWPPSISTSSR
jgi:hypothetical protein